MSELTPERRQEILELFPAINNERLLDPRASTQVRATDRATQLIEKVRGNDPAAVLFDPARVPALATRADAAADDFHRLAADGALRYDTHDTDYNPHDPSEQGVGRIWRVGTNYVDVVRERWHDAPNRKLSTTDYFAGMYALSASQLDYHDCTLHHRDDDCGLGCNVRLAKACGGTTRTLPVQRGTLILLFRCCWVCEELAGHIANNNYKTAVVNARADLPRGARIIPNPERNVNPAAWA